MDDILKQINLNIADNNILVLDSLINLFGDTKEHTVAIRPKMAKTCLDFILRHNTYRIVPDLIYLQTIWEAIPIDSIKSIYNHLPEQSKTSLMGKLALKQIEDSEREKNALEPIPEDTSVGNPAPDFTRKDFSGKTIRLSDFKNKNFVLLDFWASWCAPCIKEIPKLKKLHEKYNKKGLTIISISSDDDRNSWISAINNFQLEAWPQILSVEDENNSFFSTDNISLTYNVETIPHFILINKQGKIIANWGYLGEEQLNEIDKILK